MVLQCSCPQAGLEPQQHHAYHHQVNAYRHRVYASDGDYLPVLAGITSPNIHHKSHISNITKEAMENPDHILHQRVSSAATVSRQHIRSRQPFTRHSAHLLSAEFDMHKAWNNRVDHSLSSIRTTCPPPSSSLPPGADLPRKQWVRLNHLHSGTVRVGEILHHWGMQDSEMCMCGYHPTQTVQHVVTDCVQLRSPSNLSSLCSPDEATRTWLHGLPLEL